MPSTTTDRLYGLTTSVAVKASVKAGTTAEITLAGHQTIDGVDLVTGDRVLVKNQSNAVLNGIYSVQTGDWVRVPDFNGSLDTVTGTIVEINYGTLLSVTLWRCTTAGVIVIGTDELNFEPLSLAAGANTLLVEMTFVGTPDNDGFMGAFVCKDSATFAANLAGGEGYTLSGFIGNFVSNDVISITLNGDEVALVTIAGTRDFTCATTDGLPWSVQEDDVIAFYAAGLLTGSDYAMSFAGPLG